MRSVVSFVEWPLSVQEKHVNTTTFQSAGVSVQSASPGWEQRLVPGVTVKDKLGISVLLESSCHCGMLPL